MDEERILTDEYREPVSAGAWERIVNRTVERYTKRAVLSVGAAGAFAGTLWLLLDATSLAPRFEIVMWPLVFFLMTAGGVSVGGMLAWLTEAGMIRRITPYKWRRREYAEPWYDDDGEIIRDGDRDVPVNGNGGRRQVPVEREARRLGEVEVPGPVVAWLACNYHEGLRRNTSAAGRGVCDTPEARGANFGHAEYGQMKQAARDAGLIDAAAQWTHEGLMWLGVLLPPTPQDDGQ